jgi:hypothetical protein
MVSKLQGFLTGSDICGEVLLIDHDTVAVTCYLLDVIDTDPRFDLGAYLRGLVRYHLPVLVYLLSRFHLGNTYPLDVQVVSELHQRLAIVSRPRVLGPVLVDIDEPRQLYL